MKVLRIEHNDELTGILESEIVEPMVMVNFDNKGIYHMAELHYIYISLDDRFEKTYSNGIEIKKWSLWSSIYSEYSKHRKDIDRKKKFKKILLMGD